MLPRMRLGSRLGGRRGACREACDGLRTGDRGEGFDRLRLTQKISLSLTAELGCEELQFRTRLYAFRHHRKVEAASEAEDSADDRRRLLVVVDGIDEGLVDLELVEGKGAQICER